MTKKDAKQYIGEWKANTVGHELAGMGGNMIGVPRFHAGVHLIIMLFHMFTSVVDNKSDSYRYMIAQLRKHDQAMTSDKGIAVSGQRMFHFVHGCGLPLFARHLGSVGQILPVLGRLHQPARERAPLPVRLPDGGGGDACAVLAAHPP